MYNDCWPAALSWSLVDYYGCPKAGYYSFARADRPVLAAIDPSDGCYRATVCNLYSRPVSGTVTVSRIDAAGARTVLYPGETRRIGYSPIGETTPSVTADVCL